MNSKGKLALGIMLVTAAIFGMLLRIAGDVALLVHGTEQVNDGVAMMIALIMFLAGTIFLVSLVSRKEWKDG